MKRRAAHGASRSPSAPVLRVAWILMLLVAVAPSMVAAQIPAAERAVLEDLFNATQGWAWTDNSNWCAQSCPVAPANLLTDADFGAAGTECYWFGITCDAMLAHVVAIQLADNHLTSNDNSPTNYRPLPDLTNLSSLATFDIGFNGSLADQNTVNSPFPAFDAALQTFRASANHMSDVLPASAPLATLDVWGNFLHGATPDLSAWPNLGYFDVSANSVGALGATQQNTLCGANSKLQVFLAASDGLTGSIPDLSDCTNLQTLNVSGNALTGSVPDLAGLAQLQELDVSSNQLSGTLPDCAQTPALVSLAAYANQFSGPIPPLGACVTLQDFSVASNQLTGPLPVLTGLVALRKFDVSVNELYGALPDLSEAPSLAIFAASLNQLSGPLPSLAPLANLIVFDVGDNQLSGGLPALSAPTSLLVFRAGNNQLSGNVPALSNLAQLLTFDVSGNQLSGSAPDVSGLSSLAVLLLDHNQLSGDFPDVSGTTSLRLVDVSHNQLVGTLPDLGAMTALIGFYADHNQFSGALPANYQMLPNLVGFAVGHNGLTGSLPPDMSAMDALQAFDIAGNQLSGTLPLPAPLLSVHPAQVHLCPNPLTIGGPNDAAWAGADGASPWWAIPFASNECDDFFADSFE